MEKNFIWKVSLADALNWELYGECLAYALVDAAVSNAPENIRDNEEGSDISVVNGEFVVTLFAEGG